MMAWKNPPKPTQSIQQKVIEKRAELDYLRDIRKTTSTLTGQLHELEGKLDTMADGAESAALVLSNWQNVVKSVSLASLGLMNYSKKDYEELQPLPECLVRIKLEKEPRDNEEHIYDHDDGDINQEKDESPEGEFSARYTT